jgi:DnaJ domain
MKEHVAAYGVLGVELSASADEIKRKYHELARSYHPDRWPRDSPRHAEATARMQQVNEAYGLICDAPMRTVTERHVRFDGASIGADGKGSVWARPIVVSAGLETILNGLGGAGVGLLIVAWLWSIEMPGAALYGWLVPLIIGVVSLERGGLRGVIMFLWELVTCWRRL